MLDTGCLSFTKCIVPIDNNGATATSTAFDTSAVSGASEVMLLVMIGNSAGTTTAFKIQECATSGGSYTDIPTAALRQYTGTSKTGTDATGFTAIAATGTFGDDSMHAAIIPLGGTRLQFFKLVFTSSAAAMLVSAVWIAGRINQSPDTATKKGLAQFLYVTNGA